MVVLPLGQSRLGGQRGPSVGEQLGGGLVKAYHRPLRVIGFGIEVQDVLHMGYEVGAYLGNAPVLLLPRLKDVFFRCSRTVSWDRDGALPQLHHLPSQQPQGPMVMPRRR